MLSKSRWGSQVVFQHSFGIECFLLLQYRAFLFTEITDTKHQMTPVTCTLDILNFYYVEWKTGGENDGAAIHFCLIIHQDF